MSDEKYIGEDICDRLVRFSKHKQCMSTDLEVEAAAEITRLREENARLVDILDDVLAQWDGDWPEELYERVKAAIRKAGKEG